MFFGRKKSQQGGSKSSPASADFQEFAPVTHGRFTIFPRAKRLNNGRWIARIELEEGREEGSRRYDFAGPMSEFASSDEARQAGVEYARRRLGELDDAE